MINYFQKIVKTWLVRPVHIAKHKTNGKKTGKSSMTQKTILNIQITQACQPETASTNSAHTILSTKTGKIM